MSGWPLDIGVAPYYSDKWRAIYCADCRGLLPLFDGGASAVVTDPPYNLSFMGKAWDSTGVSFQPDAWRVIREACKPGAPLLSFGGTRTFHRIACAIEDAGWEIRDTVMWIHGQGFPKSLDVSKAIDKAAGAERRVLGVNPNALGRTKHKTGGDYGKDHDEDRSLVDVLTAPATPVAQLWDGYGSALKPSFEPVCLAMNPLDGTFAENALKHDVAGLNIDGCRVPFVDDADRKQATVPQPSFNSPTGAIYNFKTGKGRSGDTYDPLKGRFPANLIHDGSDEVLELFPQSRGQQGDVRGTEPSHTGGKGTSCYGEYGRVPATRRGDNGSAARFFYCAKASRSERDNGLSDLPLASPGEIIGGRAEGSAGLDNLRAGAGRTSGGRNTHPTVKPLALMTYLCKLVMMPEHNLVLDPFCGSGTTLLACGSLGIHSVGIDSDEQACELAARRCAADSVARLQRGEY